MNRFYSFLFLCAFGIASAQQTERVDFKVVKAEIFFNTQSNTVFGTYKLSFETLKDTDSIFIDAVNTNFEYLKLESISSRDFIYPVKDSLKFQIKLDKLWLLYDFKKDTDYTISFDYSVQPKKALYFVGDQIWSQGQGKYTSNWLPSINDMNDKIEFDLTITFDNKYEAIANGELLSVETNPATNTWQYDMNKPMSSYLVALAIGKYNKITETSKSGILLEYYYYQEDSLKAEPTYRYSQQMFDFLEEEIGVPYPWEVYRQVPVKDFLYSGMENTSLTIFSDALMTDAIGFKDRNYVNVNAHEMAHQWFGDLVTETNGTHHWLHEGFATYYALLAERELFGDDYYYWRLYEYAQQLLEQEKAGVNTSLLDPNSSSLIFYQKGCWALHMLKEQIGEDVFREAVKEYLLKFQYKNVETSDFIEAAEQASGQNLREFVKIWLETIALPKNDMVQSLKKSEFVREYLDVDCYAYPLKCKDYLVSNISDKAKVKIISQDLYTVKQEDFSNSWEVRQAIAQNINKIPLELKKNYESLLHDGSYLTVEAALYMLWVTFPEDRVKYLNQTKDIYGFSDFNVRLLWLALHLNTIEYQPEMKQVILHELMSFTRSAYGFELRMNAFNYLKLINGFDEFSIQNLLEASKHHNWRFQQFAKELLEELKQNEVYKAQIENLQIKH